VERVNAAEEQTASLVSQTATLARLVGEDNMRVSEAHTSAMAALNKEMKTFTDATTMADVMRNFDTKATGERNSTSNFCCCSRGKHGS
jgi:hypothetical protein